MAKRQDASMGKIVDTGKTDLPKDRFHLKVFAPFKIYYEGVVASISAENGTGPFDVLANHHNFITLLNPCELIIRDNPDDKEPESIKITRGIMQVKANDVLVFLDV